jgi:hypothetical protein
MTEQIGKVDQTRRINAVFFHPLEYRTEICSSSAFRFQFNGLGWPEFLDSLHCGIAIHHVNGLGLCFITDAGYLASKLVKFFVANGARSIYTNDNGSQASACNRRQVPSGSDKAPVGADSSDNQMACDQPQNRARLITNPVSIGHSQLGAFRPRRIRQSGVRQFPYSRESPAYEESALLIESLFQPQIRFIPWVIVTSQSLCHKPFNFRLFDYGGSRSLGPRLGRIQQSAAWV